MFDLDGLKDEKESPKQRNSSDGQREKNICSDKAYVYKVLFCQE